MDSSSGESAPEMGASHSKYRAPPDSTFSVEEIAALIRIYDTVSDDTQTVVVQEKLRAVFPCACFEGFSAGLYDALRGEHEDLDFAQFVRGVMHGCRQNSPAILRFYLCAVCGPSTELSLEQLRAFLKVAYEFASGESFAEVDVHLLLFCDYVKRHVTNSTPIPETGSPSTTVSVTAFVQFTNEYLPHVAKIFVTWMTHKVFSSIALPAFEPFLIPRFARGESAILRQCHCFLLSILQMQLQGTWTRLYTSEADGLSFNRVCHHTLGYDGPTIVVMRDTRGAVFGMFAATRWRESNSFYGEDDSFLFRLRPSFEVYRPRSHSNSHFQYLNLKGFSLPHGMGMGGTTDEFRVHIPESFDICTANTSCLTFESGPLAASTEFEIDGIEVWGCGGPRIVERALVAQEKDRAQRATNIRKARTVDKAQFVNNEFDRSFLLGKTFGGAGAGKSDASPDR